jgi:hypothetical protein
MKRLFALAAVAASLSLAACGEKREAEATVGNTQVEISTTAPENLVPDEQLNAVAEGAAAAAATAGGSSTSVVVAPPSSNTTP